MGSQSDMTHYVMGNYLSSAVLELETIELLYAGHGLMRVTKEKIREEVVQESKDEKKRCNR